MLRLTDLLGEPVRLADGTPIGKMLDLSVRVGGDAPVVERLLIGRRTHVGAVASWDAVEQLRPDIVVRAVTAVEPPASMSDALELHHDELLLGRDVLDTQIVDTVGQRLSRVGDVILTPDPEDGLHVVAVDVGVAALLHRLRLHRFEEPRREDAIAWADLHLTSARGHKIQLGTAKSAVHHLAPAELATLVTRLSVGAGAEVLAQTEPGRAAAALEHAPTELSERMIRALPDAHAELVMRAASPRRRERYRHILRHPADRKRRYLRHRGWRRPKVGSPTEPDKAPPT